MMYSVISANRGVGKVNKNWRVFEKEMLEKHFGKVLDVDGEDGHSVIEQYEKYKDDIRYIRWYPDPDEMNREEYEGMLKQRQQIGDIPFITNSPIGFLSVQNKEVAFARWKDVGVNCPDFFTYEDKNDFYKQREKHPIAFPFLVRLNNSVGGYNTYKVDDESMLDECLTKLDNEKPYSETGQTRRILTKKLCVELVNSVDESRGVNTSFRLHVAGDRIVSGYARVVDKSDWCAITAGKFSDKHINDFIIYNKLCETIMTEHEEYICSAVHCLGLNHQGVDVIINQEDNSLSFLEVQPTYAAGYSDESGIGHWYSPPFYNPKEPNLVKFLTENMSELKQHIPRYCYNWLDKRNHFDLVYKSIKEFIDVRS